MSDYKDRIIRAAKLDVDLYEEVEADKGALGQAMGVVVFSSVYHQNTKDSSQIYWKIQLVKSFTHLFHLPSEYSGDIKSDSCQNRTHQDQDDCYVFTNILSCKG